MVIVSQIVECIVVMGNCTNDSPAKNTTKNTALVYILHSLLIIGAGRIFIAGALPNLYCVFILYILLTRHFLTLVFMLRFLNTRRHPTSDCPSHFIYFKRFYVFVV
jgi:hypothetical protein